MRFLVNMIAVSCVLFTVSCESVRTVYDEDGQLVKERKPGENSSLEDRFTGGFDTKKNALGVEEANSKKVSSFQAAIDSSRDASSESSFQGLSYGKKETMDIRDKSFIESMSSFAGNKSVKDSSKSAYTPDDVPAFMKGGRGITPESYAGSSKKSSAGERVYNTGEAYERVMSSTSTGQRSGYFESKPEAQKTVYSQEEYAQKTIEDTRGMLQRDKTQY